MKCFNNQQGIVHVLSLLVIIAAVGIISFLLISSTFPTGGLFDKLNPKPASHASGGTVYPLKVSANKRYLVDQNNTPFFMVGDSPQALIGNVSESDADIYFTNREKDGFNTVWINLLCDSYTFCNSDGTTFDGIKPFNTPGDLSTPNPVYFTKVDHIIQLAANHGLVVFLDPIETGGWLGTMNSNGQTKDFNYGVFLGNRYKNMPNIVWMSGNDFQSWQNSSDDASVKAVANGIKSVDPNHIQTTELNYNQSSSLDDQSWSSIVGLNSSYTYFPTYDQIYHSYNQTPTMPTFMVEAHYEVENVGPGTGGTPLVLRKQAYWTTLSGAIGQIYGSFYTDRMDPAWKQNLDLPGALQLAFWKNLFAQRAWYNLVPDQGHSIITSGFGTYTAGGDTGNNDYATAARTPDGSLVMAYIPTRRTVTIDMTKLAASANAQWFDPTNGTYTQIAGSPIANIGAHQFTPPGNNSIGDGDWALVLETGVLPSLTPSPTPCQTCTPLPTPISTPTPVPTSTPLPPTTPTFMQVNSAVPQTAQSTISVPYVQSQTAGDTNILAIGWNDTTSSISTVTDSLGNNYQVAAPTNRGNGVSQAIYYAKNIKGGSNTVTVTFNQAAAAVDIRNLEYSGLDTVSPFDVQSSASGTATTANSGSATTTTGNELIFGAGITTGGFSGGAGFTTRIITNPDSDIAEDKVVVSAGSNSASAPVSGNWVMQMATFKSATSASTPTPSAIPTPTPTPPCPKMGLGDIDCDGSIGIFDYNILVGNFGKSAIGIQGDLDGNNTVNIFDYNILVTNFGH